MSKRKCCCGQGEEPIRADCDVTGCIRVTFSGISPIQQSDGFATGQAGGDPGLFWITALAGVNRTFYFDYPTLTLPTQFCSEGFVLAQQNTRTCADPERGAFFWGRGMRVQLSLVCIANRLRVERLRLLLGGPGGAGAQNDAGCPSNPPTQTAGGIAFEFWPDFLGQAFPTIGFGTTVQNHNASIWAPDCNPLVARDGLALNGSARVEMFAGSCSPPTVYAVAARCGDPSTRISVDTATNPGGVSHCYQAGELYALTGDTTTDAPVAVTWTADECPSSAASIINRGRTFHQAQQIGVQASRGSRVSSHPDPAVRAHMEAQERQAGGRPCCD